MGFQVGEWLHEVPAKEFDTAGKRNLVKRLCFGPLETQIWCELKDGSYSHEIHFIEGIQDGEVYVNSISKSEMLEVLKYEIALCQKYGKPEIVSLFRNEVERIEFDLILHQAI